MNENYICMLKLCNNEFSVMVYIRKVLCSDDIMECLYSNDESGRELQTCTLQKNENDDGEQKQCCTHDDLASLKLYT